MKISIITISYNNIEGLKRTVDSVLSQSFIECCEYIIIDGGSDDGTKEYLSSLPSSVIRISEKDRGISHAFNKGINFSSGEYLLCLNAGDVFSSNTVIEQVCADIANYTEDIISYKVKVTNNTYIPNTDSESEIWDTCTMAHQGTFVSKQVYNKIGIYSEDFKIRMDYQFFARCKKNKISFKYLNNVICDYEPGGTSMALSNRKKFFREGLAVKLLYSLNISLKDIVKFLLYRK